MTPLWETMASACAFLTDWFSSQVPLRWWSLGWLVALLKVRWGAPTGSVHTRLAGVCMPSICVPKQPEQRVWFRILSESKREVFFMFLFCNGKSASSELVFALLLAIFFSRKRYTAYFKIWKIKKRKRGRLIFSFLDFFLNLDMVV